MPLAVFDSSQALRNMQKRASLWPRRYGGSSRLGEIAQVSSEASFKIDSADMIFTTGSCFARNIEYALRRKGFRLANDPTGSEDTELAVELDALLNKYTVHSMAYELEWALNDCLPDEGALYVEVSPGLWHDLHLAPNVAPASLERVRARRQFMINATRNARSCKVFILTLGLAESWFDREHGLYLNGIPPMPVLKAQPDRFELRLLDYNEMVEALDHIHDVISGIRGQDVNMIVTVSPVPFKATFTGVDALTANTYGKSAQRAAAEAFSRKHENVDYFPSFETVTLSERKSVYEEDNIHVRSNIVSGIMESVIHRYGEDKASEPSIVTPTKNKLASLDTLIARFIEQRHDENYIEATITAGAILSIFSEKLSVEDGQKWQKRLAEVMKLSEFLRNDNLQPSRPADAVVVGA